MQFSDVASQRCNVLLVAISYRTSEHEEERLQGVERDLEILVTCDWMQNHADVISCLDLSPEWMQQNPNVVAALNQNCAFTANFDGIKSGVELWVRKIQPARMSALVYLGHGSNCQGNPRMQSADGVSIPILNLYTYLCEGRPCTCAALFFSCCQSNVSTEDERPLFQDFPARMPDNCWNSQAWGTKTSGFFLDAEVRQAY